ncbi:MAG: site-2 protease family protein [Candidatus Sumerlaeaceae bacterium]
MIDILRGGVAVVVLISFAIFIHELGHYMFAKLFGVAVETFSIGFGKKIWKVKRGQTEYCISAIPLGGYVKMVGTMSKEMEEIISGEKPATPEQEADAELAAAELSAPAPVSLGASVVREVDALRSKPYWQKILVFSAGCINNFLTAVCVLFLMDWIGHHEPAPTLPIVESVEHVDVSRAGLQPGDRVLSVNGRPTKEYIDILVAYQKAVKSDKKPAYVGAVVERAGTTITTEIPSEPPVEHQLPEGKVIELNGKKVGTSKSIIRAVDYLLSVGKKEPVSVVVHTKSGENISTSAPLLALAGEDWLQLSLQPHQPAYVVQPIPNLPAEKAGIRVGDEIVSVANVPVTSAVRATREIRKHLGETVPVEVKRGSAKSGYSTVTLQVDVRPHPENPKLGQIGIAFGPGPFTDFVKRPFGEAFIGGFTGAYNFGVRYIIGIGDLLQSSFQTVRENVGGPIAIGTMAYKAANEGWMYYLTLFISFNVILAITNLLPLPILDGGHILFSTIEAIIRRPLPAKFMLVIYNTFTFLIIGLALAITFNDVIMNWWRLR